MTDQLHRRWLTFSLRTLFACMTVLAVLCGAYRLNPVLAALTVYAGVLVFIMAWYAWSDLVMSICTVLFIVGAILITFIGSGQSLH